MKFPDFFGIIEKKNRKLYLLRDDKLLIFLDFHISLNMFIINENIINKIITQIFAEVRQKPAFPGPPGYSKPPRIVGITNNIFSIFL